MAGETVNWVRIKQLRFDWTRPFIVQYKYDLSANEFKELNVMRVAKRGRPTSIDHPPPAYESRLPISAAKKKDLLKLLKDRVIPAEYGQWYSSLPVSKSVRDNLPEPSANETEPEQVPD